MSPIENFRKYEQQLFLFWNELTADQQRAFESQLKQICLETLNQQKKLVHDAHLFYPSTIDPFDEFAFSGDKIHHSLGQQLIQRGEVGCLLLAGGQGTRLQHSGPKGTYPISPFKHKSLFQLCAEKVRAASAWAHRPLQLAIMTSPDNDEETRDFFQQRHFFGLAPSQVSFFVQGSLPFLDAQGKLFLKTPSQVATGADGNGNSLLSFAASGLLKTWLNQGIKAMTIILVDNPLADPFDAELVGFHYQQNADMTLKCTEKTDPEEKVGVLVKQEGRCTVVEYSEMPESEKKARRSDGRLKHCCANLSLFCLSLRFIQKIVKEDHTLPLHKAWKAAQFVDEKGMPQCATKPNAWKFETFIFDWLMHAKKVAALIYPREECFAPLKNLSGPDSPETVRRALQERDRAVLQHLTGLPPPDFLFELPPEFYYPSQDFQAEWQGREAVLSDFDV